MTISFSRVLFAVGSVSLAASQPTYAQTAPARQSEQADRGAGLEEIIVSAQRREERLQDVPISITALTPDQLQSQQLSTVQDLVRIAPSASRSISRGDPTALLLSLRGVPTSVPSILQDSSVGVYINGVYMARTQGQGLGMVDMSGVEVLAGPQGTLFGRNTIGGALNLTTQKPEHEFGGYISGTGGNFNTTNAEAVLNVPVSENLATRFVYSHQEHDGYLHNTNPRGIDANGLDANYYRGSLLFTPDNWEISVVADYVKNDSANIQTNVRYVEPTIPTAFLWQPPTDDIFDVNTAQRDRLKVENWGASATISRMFDNVTIKSITGYRRLKTRSDNATLPGRSPGPPFTSVPAGEWIPLVNVVNNGVKHYHSVSEELQAFGYALDGRLRYIVGGYFFEEKGRDGFAIEALGGISFPVDLGPPAGVVMVPVQDFSQNTFLAKNRSVSGFAQLTYEIAPELRLTGGIRYTKDTRDALQSTFKYARPGGYYDGATACVLPPELNPQSQPTYPFCTGRVPQVSDSFFPWTVGLDYNVNADLLLYSKVSRGYRSGGQGPGGAADPAFFEPFSPEKLTSYEVGLKGDFFDRHLRVSTAAYYSDYTSVQQFLLQVPRGARNGIPVIINSGDARIYGGELNLAALLGDRLTVNAAVGYTNAKYTGGPFKSGGLAYPGGPTYLPDTPYNLSPEWTLALGVDYPIDVAKAGTLNLHADYSYRSEVYYSRLFAGFTDFNNQLSEPGYSLVNALASFELSSIPLTVSVYAKNVFDKEYAATIQEGFSLGAVYQYAGEPRTYGMTIKYSFGGE